MEKPAHFQTVLESESQRLNILCTKWQEIFDSSPNLTDELSGQILLVVGKFVPTLYLSLSLPQKRYVGYLNYLPSLL